jgi:PAS fold
MNRSMNAVGNSIPARQPVSRDLGDTDEPESIQSAAPTITKNRAFVDNRPYDEAASTTNNDGKGSWRWNIRTDTSRWSEELYRIIGRDDPTIPPFREHFRFYTSESWIRLVDATLELLRTGTPYELKLEMLHTDGSRRWVIRKGKPVLNERGEIVELRGTVQAVTERAFVADGTEPNPQAEWNAAESNAGAATLRLVRAQEEENARLIIKFRENICKRLSLLAATIEGFRSAFPDSPPQSETQLEPDTEIAPLWQKTTEVLGDVELPEPDSAQLRSAELRSAELRPAKFRAAASPEFAD